MVQDTVDRKAGGNTRLASCGVTCLNSSSIFQMGFSARLTVLFSEIPHERQAWERWWQAQTVVFIRIRIKKYFLLITY